MLIRDLAKSAACLALAIAMPAQAAQNGITYDCDTAANHYSDLVLPTPQGPFTVRGQIRLNQVASSDQYVPMTGIAIADALDAPGASSKDAAGFKLVAMHAKLLGVKTKDKDAVLQFQQWNEVKGGTEVAHDPIPLPDTQNGGAFSLSYDGKSVTVEFAGQRRDIPLTAATPVVRLTCSTGEFLYTDLIIQGQ